MPPSRGDKGADMGCKYYSNLPLNHCLPVAKEYIQQVQGIFYLCGEPDFSMVNSCLKDCLPLQSFSQWEHEVSLLGTHVCISFEQEHFAPVDVLLFNCSQLFSLLIFFPFS